MKTNFENMIRKTDTPSACRTKKFFIYKQNNFFSDKTKKKYILRKFNTKVESFYLQ